MNMTEKSRIPALASSLAGVALAAASAYLAVGAIYSGQPSQYAQAALLISLALIFLTRSWGTISLLIVLATAVFTGVVRAGTAAVSLVEFLHLLAAALVPLFLAISFYATRQKNRSMAAATGVLLVLATTLSLGAVRNTLSPIDNRSVYVEMRDGVRLATDYRLPRGYDGTPRPVIITFTRYHRSSLLRFPFNLLFSRESGNTRRLLNAGYAVVVVDVRGSGASFGNRTKEFSQAEIEDFPQIVDWVIEQPWSNGLVGAEGVSYGGTTAELLMLQEHPAVRAIAGQYSLFDAYEDAAFPGGLENIHITSAWGQMLRALDLNQPPPGVPWLARVAWRGVRPVDGADGERLLQKAIQTHRRNYDMSEGLGQIEFRDDRLNGENIFDGSPANYLSQLQSNRTPYLLVSGWLDGAYQNAAFKKLANSRNPDLYTVIGPWDHGPATSIDPCENGHNARRGQRSSFTLPFYNHYLRGEDNGYANTPRIRYYMLCAGEWHASETWPPTAKTHLLFIKDAALTPAPSKTPGSRASVVNPQASSGDASRWAALVRVPGANKPTGYGNRAEASDLLMNFNSAPLDQALQIAGHPRVSLTLQSSSPDGALIVYLEDVAPDGTVRYVTEGSLRLGSRATDSTPEHRDFSPVRLHLRSSYQPMPEDSAIALELGLLPVAYRFAQGHRIRLSIAGADVDNFRPVAKEAPEYRIYWGPANSSSLSLPLEASEPTIWERPEQEYSNASR